MKESYKFDDSGNLNSSKGKEFVPPRKVREVNLKAIMPKDREDVSEKISEDSASGWVKKNINEFEPTEGRL